jgi:RimJ/RimL family protein N-acetyltransferase
MPPSVTLTGHHVQLEPLVPSHVDELLAAATESRDSYGYTWVPDTAASMKSYVDTAVAERAAAQAVPYLVRWRETGRAAGCTRFFDFRDWSGRDLPDALEIGHTWYAASAQRTACNTETKLLLLSHAFENWRASRVQLKTDARNARSRAAIARLGAQFEGILRSDRPASDGGLRDTAYYSVIATEWPAVRENLRHKLSATADRSG